MVPSARFERATLPLGGGGSIPYLNYNLLITNIFYVNQVLLFKFIRVTYLGQVCWG